MIDGMKEIREKYEITREELDQLDMDEFDYENTQIRALKNYIKGHLVDICKLDGSVDIEQIAENIHDIAKVYTDQESLQKAVLGEIVGCQNENTHRGQLVSVSWKITEKLYRRV